MRPLAPSRLTAAIAGCVLCAAAGGAGVSFAFLTNPAQSSANSVEAGTLVLSDVVQGSSVLPATIVRFGGSGAAGLQVVGNGGTVGGELTVRPSDIADPQNTLSAKLHLRIQECGSLAGPCTATATRYDGTLTGAAAAAAPIALGSLAASGQKRFRVQVSWPLSAGDNSALYDDTTTFKLQWRLRTS